MTAADKPSPIPHAYRRVTPCLVVQGAARALDFYAQVFGAAERMRTIAHAEIEIGDSVVIVEDEDPQRGTAAPPACPARRSSSSSTWRTSMPWWRARSRSAPP